MALGPSRGLPLTGSVTTGRFFDLLSACAGLLREVNEHRLVGHRRAAHVFNVKRWGPQKAGSEMRFMCSRHTGECFGNQHPGREGKERGEGGEEADT